MNNAEVPVPQRYYFLEVMGHKGFRELSRDIFSYRYTILGIWLVAALYYTYQYIGYSSINNYLIFKFTYFNAARSANLYAQYPQFYADSNHYGPIFTLIIAPFAVLKGTLGIYLWQICNVSFLFFVIQKLPFNALQKNIICLACTQELIISLKEFQTNGAIAALIILAWIMVEQKKDLWAALFVMLGLFIKLYGVIGIAFFLFSKNKMRFIAGLGLWAVVLFVLPMLFFNPHFIANSYIDWYHSLINKNLQNTDIHTRFQDISVTGMIRRIAGHTINLTPVLLAAVAIFGVSALKVAGSQDVRQRLRLLSSCLLFVVLFSTGSENVTYIIAFTGIGIWYMANQGTYKRQLTIAFILIIYCGSLYGTDIFPQYIKTNYMDEYALKALPCLLVWLTLVAEMFTAKTPIAKGEAAPDEALSILTIN